MNFSRNNLDKAQSPYLRQHLDNPVWWQEWTPEVLEHAQRNGKLLFVSVGYSTCHWCHVMAHDTFSDGDCADFLNEHFVAIKVDREERPDIDQYMMDFLVAATGQGGWPLNVVLTPDLRPFFGVTYLGSQSRFGRPGFREVMEKVLRFSREKDEAISAFNPSAPTLGAAQHSASTPEDAMRNAVEQMWSRYDAGFGGFGESQKFPPHATLLFSLYLHAAHPDEKLIQMIRGTLDAICRGGLNDHLQGGFFRYCTDRAWTIPHFEKMLYDQAMLLWLLSIASTVLDEPRYAQAARGTLRALRESFHSGDGLFVSAHDADTDREEGGTYLWTRKELEELLSPAEIEELEKQYQLPAQGNFEGKIHLIRREETPQADDDGATAATEDSNLAEIREKLLAQRRSRPQPSVDDKAVTSWNALAGIGLLHAYRYLGDEAALSEARQLFDHLWERHIVDGEVRHASRSGKVGSHAFLQDAAAMLLLASYLHEDSRDLAEHIEVLRDVVRSFRGDDQWLEGMAEDFMPIPAPIFDSPTPSAVSLAELALLRRDMLSGELYDERNFGAPLIQDALNIAALASSGYFYLIEAPEPLAWERLPVNAVQAPGEQTTFCYKGLCTPGLPDVAHDSGRDRR
ncbi:MAG: DUF255 domain-containing protein [Spirochaetes bacterium]|jgi:uncharacterized protein YyaL (SSP411 family)|nr:DUF255 domain-containing protein [Spirochaetota bacterium]